MQAARAANTIAIRLEPGEDVHASILEACRQHGARGGFVVSGIGMLADPELGFFVGKGRYESRRFEGRYECLSLAGNIAEKYGELMAHLHAMCGTEGYDVFGGHVISARAGVTLEIGIAVVDEPVKMYREVEPETGLPGLQVE